MLIVGYIWWFREGMFLGGEVVSYLSGRKGWVREGEKKKVWEMVGGRSREWILRGEGKEGGKRSRRVRIYLMLV